MRHRVKLLGELEIFGEDGTPLDAPDPTQARLLVALALRPSTPRPVAELSSIVWDDWGSGWGPNLETPVSRVRKLIPIEGKKRSTDTYRTSLPRSAVDATDFIDKVGAGTTGVADFDQLLGLWRGDPMKLYTFIPETEWRSLLRARDHLIEQLESWSRHELAQLGNLEHFCVLFPSATERLTPGDSSRRKRLLIVDDDEQLTSMLADLLHDYHCVVARTTAEAIDVVSDTTSPLDGALVDLHLTRNLDSSGIAILSALQNLRPDVPRVLLTSSPPADGMTEVLRTYGLFEVLVKDGAHAPIRTRMTIDSMLGNSPDSARRRARATFESIAVTAERTLRSLVVQARKRERRGEELDPTLKDGLLDDLTALDDDIASTRTSLDTCTPDDSHGHVEAFRDRWSRHLEHR